MTVSTTAARAFLRGFLVEKFSLGEMRVLAFDLGLNYEAFNHSRVGDFSVDLVSYFERRGQLDFLAREILKRRPNDELAGVLAALPPSSGRKKAQLIIDRDIIENLDRLHQGLAQYLGLSLEDVMIIGTMPGSVRALIGLPAASIDKLYELEGVGLYDGEMPIISVVDFESLMPSLQCFWQSQVTRKLEKDTTSKAITELLGPTTQAISREFREVTWRFEKKEREPDAESPESEEESKTD